MESNSYEEVSKKIKQMVFYVTRSATIKEKNKEMLEEETSIYIKYISLYIATILFLRLYHEIFDTSELNDMIK